jgi:hypothetical protein
MAATAVAVVAAAQDDAVVALVHRVHAAFPHQTHGQSLVARGDHRRLRARGAERVPRLDGQAGGAAG